MATKCKNKKKYHFTYYTTNLINNKIYYGVHSTNNLSDGYIGSGKLLQRAIKKYGNENFILKIDKFFEMANEAYEYESIIVTENFIKRNDTYNICDGGWGGWKHNAGKGCYIDKSGNRHYVSTKHKKVISNEWEHINKGKKLSKETKRKISISNQGRKIKFTKEWKENLSKVRKGKVPVKDKNGNTFLMKVNDERLKSGEVKRFINYSRNPSKESIEKRRKKLIGTALVIDDNGNKFRIKITDKGYKNKYKPIVLDRIHIFNKETLQKKMVYEYEWKNKYSKNKNWALGRYFKKINIYNDKVGLRKTIKENEWNEYKSNGWKLGIGKDKYKKIHIHNPLDKKRKMIYEYEYKRHSNIGWKIGRGKI